MKSCVMDCFNIRRFRSSQMKAPDAIQELHENIVMKMIVDTTWTSTSQVSCKAPPLPGTGLRTRGKFSWRGINLFCSMTASEIVTCRWMIRTRNPARDLSLGWAFRLYTNFISNPSQEQSEVYREKMSIVWKKQLSYLDSPFLLPRHLVSVVPNLCCEWQQALRYIEKIHILYAWLQSCNWSGLPLATFVGKWTWSTSCWCKPARLQCRYYFVFSECGNTAAQRLVAKYLHLNVKSCVDKTKKCEGNVDKATLSSSGQFMPHTTHCSLSFRIINGIWSMRIAQYYTSWCLFNDQDKISITLSSPEVFSLILYCFRLPGSACYYVLSRLKIRDV